MQAAVQDTGDVSNADFPLDGEGRTFHLGVSHGDVANRILTVGSLTRAEFFSTLLDNVEYKRVSARGFNIFTGTYKGQRVSLVGSGMGYPMMDFMVRETRAVTDGPMAYVRFGTCGSVAPEDVVPIGKFVLTKKCMLIQRDFDNATFRFSKYVDPDQELYGSIKAALPEGSFVEGGTGSADTFYASQGRPERDFEDNNAHLLEELHKQYPDLINLEMEHFHLLHLAKHSKPGRKVYAAAVAVVIAHRYSKVMLAKAKEKELELLAGKCILDALVQVNLDRIE